LLRYLKNLKIDLIVSSLAVVSLLTLSGTAAVLIPTLTTPVMAAPSTVAPVPVPPAPLPAVVPKPKTAAMPTVGNASWYGLVLQGHHTASGERFNPADLTAAHRTLPFGTLVRVVDLHTGHSVIVRINDRGVLFADRVIDLSSAAANELGILREGVAKVRLEVLKKTPATPKAVDAKADTEAAAL
jgi:rare lipoprotein A